MVIDESFKKPGAIPFKWEIRPGLPKRRQSPPRKTLLRPPPAAAVHALSGQRSRSERWRFDRAEVVTVGCFPASPLLKRKLSVKHKKNRDVSVSDSEKNDDVSDLETPTRWSVSSRMSLLSPFRDSPTSFCSSSDRYSPSPRAISDAEWAGFALF